jgi:hypothetical protein
MGENKGKPAETAKLPARTAAQRLKHVKHLALPDIERMRAQVAEFAERVDRKLDDIPAERIIDPPATITAPAALQYALLGEGPEVSELREMFENLLASSMDRDTTASAHPAFVSMIAQLTPDEAWILKAIDRGDYAAVNVFDLGRNLPLGFRTMFGLGTGIDESRQQQYISNLDRLGIIRIEWGSHASDRREGLLLDERVNAEFPDRALSIRGGTISVTPLGWQFLDTCVRARAQRAE